MLRITVILTMLVALLTACTPAPTANQLGADGKPLPRLYRIHDRDSSKIQVRMLDSVNALRSASGAGAVVLNSQLTAAAALMAPRQSIGLRAQAIQA
jgi:uncharacterized protein YkwD